MHDGRHAELSTRTRWRGGYRVQRKCVFAREYTMTASNAYATEGMCEWRNGSIIIVDLA